ncbi:MAG: universal stress protein [Desulfobacterales bacterium]|jgi:nucleotide-binding universal stress UspA family protein|nr:universal stress protein [Desulfobacterales bacterium]
MLPIRKIICPTDFSEPSFKGIEAAVELAEHFSAELILVNVITPAYPFVSGVPAKFDMEQYREELLRHATESLGTISKDRIPDGVGTRKVVRQGSAVDEIIQLAESEHADLIVIATHGWTGWRKWIFGSIADKVVHLAPCPVLTVSEPEKK